MMMTITMIVMIIIIMITIPLQPAGVAYMTSVAPPALVGTAISLMATVTWVVGKGVSLRIVMLVLHHNHDHALKRHLCPIMVCYDDIICLSSAQCDQEQILLEQDNVDDDLDQVGSLLSGLLNNLLGTRQMFLTVGPPTS